MNRRGGGAKGNFVPSQTSYFPNVKKEAEMKRPGIYIAVLALVTVIGCTARPVATGQQMFRHAAATVLRSLLAQITESDASAVPEASAAPSSPKLQVTPAAAKRRVQPAQVCDLPSTGRSNVERRQLRRIVSSSVTQSLVCSNDLRIHVHEVASTRSHLVVSRDGEVLGESFVIEIPEPPAPLTPIGDGRA